MYRRYLVKFRGRKKNGDCRGGRVKRARTPEPDYLAFLKSFPSCGIWGKSLHLSAPRCFHLCCCSVANLCLTLGDLLDCSTPGSSVLPYLPAAAAAAMSLQWYPTLFDPTDSSPPGSPIPGILQARTLEWVAISFSDAWKWKVKVKSLSCVRLLATPWTAAHQAPPSMGFSRQEYWSGLPLPFPRVCSHSCPLSCRCYLTISSAPFSFCLQPFPASRSFPMSWLFTSGGQRIGASAWVSISGENSCIHFTKLL